MDQQAPPINQFYILTPQGVPVPVAPQAVPMQSDSTGVVGIAGMRRMEINQMSTQLQQQQPKGVFGKLKDAIINLVTEEVEPTEGTTILDTSGEMPIGLSQLTRRTFQAANSYHNGQIMFHPSRPVHDYSFNLLVNELPPPPPQQELEYAYQPQQPFRQNFQY